MRRFNYLEVSGEKTCLKCEAVVEEKVVLTRQVRFLHGNVASVKFSCPNGCGFKLVGTVDFEGGELQEPASDLVTDEIMARIWKSKAQVREAFSAPRIIPPKSSLMARVLATSPSQYKEYKTDEEMMADVFPNAIDKAELFRILTEIWPQTIHCLDQRVERVITPQTERLGDRGMREGFTVSYSLGDVEVGTNTYFAWDGVPPDLEGDVAAVRKSFESLLVPESSVLAARAPRTPRTYRGTGVHIGDSQSGHDVTVERGRKSPLPSMGPSLR